MKEKWCIILNEMTDKESLTESVLAVFDYENAVDLMTEYFNKVACYSNDVSEKIVERLLEVPLDACVGEVVDFTDDDMVYHCSISRYYE